MDATVGGAKDNALVLLSELAVGGQMSDDACRQLHDAVSAIPEQDTCRIEARNTWLYCSACHANVNGGYSDATTHHPMRYCPCCGAKVVEQ